MKKVLLFLFAITIHLDVFAQIDTVTSTLKATLLFPAFPIKSSFSSIFDRNNQPYLYSANMESGLGIYDVSNENVITPVLDLSISNFDNLDVSTIKQYGDLLYVGLGDFQVITNAKSGLAILNVSNPLTPNLLGIWDSTYFKSGISHLVIEGDFAYLSTMKDGLIILNVSNPNHIIFVSQLQLDLSFPAPSSPNAHNARGLKYRNDSLFICFDRGGLRVVDVSNKYSPVEVYKYMNTALNSVAAAAYNDFFIKGNYAFVSVDYCGLEILDISSNPFTTVQWYNPWGCDFTNWSGADLHTNELKASNSDSLLFVSGGQSEFFIFDISNPLNTVKKGEFAIVNDSLASYGIDVFNDKISLSIIHTPFHIPPFTPFFSKDGGIKIFDYSISSIPLGTENLTNSNSLKLFPNPTNGILHINLPNKINPCFRIYDLTGQLLQEFFTTEFSVSNLPSGLYFITAFIDKGVFTSKLIKQ